MRHLLQTRLTRQIHGRLYTSHSRQCTPLSDWVVKNEHSGNN
ncbi:hypothetical protein T09_8515, partial [Trichinella sp. T9]